MKITFIVLVGLGASAALRNRSAAVRHWILAMTLVCVAATPALEATMPGWSVPALGRLIPSRVDPIALVVPLRVTIAGADEALTTGTPVPAVEPPLAVRVLSVIRLAGNILGLAVLAIGFARLRCVASRARRIPCGRWADTADALSRAYGLRRPIEVLHADHPTLLATWGLLSPKLIVPRSAETWSDERLRVVLAHELAHIRRGDWVFHVLAGIVRSVYWFNPLVWIACRRLREESERACDDEVLRLGVDGPQFASHLVELARSLGHARQMLVPVVSMIRGSRFERRVAAMLNIDANRRPVTRFACVATATVLLCVTAAMAGLGAFAQSTTASFSGSLVDTVGRIVPDVAIVLEKLTTGERQEAVSDQSGTFRFSDIPAGDYAVNVQKAGFASAQGRVTLTAGQTLQRDIALQLGSIQETFTVQASDVPQPPRVASASTSQGSDAASDPCAQSPVGGCITPPQKLRSVSPEYPQKAHDAGVGGTINLVGRIGTDGYVKDLQVIAPADPTLANAAADAVQQWQFTPTRLDGVPVEVGLRVTATFVAQR